MVIENNAQVSSWLFCVCCYWAMVKVDSISNMIWTNNQYLYVVCVQLQKVGGHPVLNGSMAAVQRIQVIVFFRVAMA